MDTLKIIVDNPTQNNLLGTVTILQGSADSGSGNQPFSTKGSTPNFVKLLPNSSNTTWTVDVDDTVGNAVAIFQLYDSFQNPMATIIVNRINSKNCTIPVAWDTSAFTVTGTGKPAAIAEPTEPVYNIKVTQP